MRLNLIKIYSVRFRPRKRGYCFDQRLTFKSVVFFVVWRSTHSHPSRHLLSHGSRRVTYTSILFYYLYTNTKRTCLTFCIVRQAHSFVNIVDIVKYYYPYCSLFIIDGIFIISKLLGPIPLFHCLSGS